VNGELIEVNLILENDVKNKNKAVSILKKKLQDKFGDVYIRGGDSNYSIIFPRETFEKTARCK